MTTAMTVGVTVGGVGLCIALLGALLLWFAKHSMSQPIVHDGIGGKDTSNLFNGCLGWILGIFCLYGGIIVTLVGGIILIIACSSQPS